MSFDLTNKNISDTFQHLLQATGSDGNELYDLAGNPIIDLRISGSLIAEDTYFLPWESDFIVDTSKKIKVEVKGQQNQPITESKKSKKPKMVVTEVKHPFDPVEKVVNILHKQGVGVSTIYESKKTMIPMLKKYSTKAGYKRGAKNFIKEVIHKLSKK